MASSLPQTREPGTVRVTLAGLAPDLVRLSLFLEAVTGGETPADVLLDLRLVAIRITETRGTRGRGSQMTMMFQLEEFPAA
jgi:hypothetical protein